MERIIRSVRSRLEIKGFDLNQFALFLLLLGLLCVLILYPILRVLYEAFTQGNGLTLKHFLNFFQRDLFREALWNSLFAGLMTVILASLISLPLAHFMVRYDFRGKMLIQTLGVLPLVMPPFVGAIGMDLILGRSGILNLLLLRWFRITIPFMEGLQGVILVQTLHYFPLILLNAKVSLKNIDPSLEEMAQNMGAHGLRLFRKITLPLMIPGCAAGALIIFVKTVGALGAPLMLDYNRMLAPQAYLSGDDKSRYVIAVILAMISLVSLWIQRKYLKRSEYATAQRGATGVRVAKRITGWKPTMILGLCVLILTISLIPHVGIVLLSFAKRWCFTLLPEEYTLSNYAEILVQVPHFVRNTMVYCSLAAGIDIALGSVMAFLLIRGRIMGKGLLDLIATLPMGVPGMVLAIGYLKAFGFLSSTWFVLVIVYSVRRLPQMLRSCYAAMQHVHESMEEAAMNLGANRRRTFLKITFPLMIRGVVAGGLTSFIGSSVDFSSTIMLVTRDEYSPLSSGIYLYTQRAIGWEPAACLGVVAIFLVAVGTYVVNRISRDRSEAASKV